MDINKEGNRTNRMLILNLLLDEIKAMSKIDPEMGVINVKFVLDPTNLDKVGFINVKFN